MKKKILLSLSLLLLISGCVKKDVPTVLPTVTTTEITTEIITETPTAEEAFVLPDYFVVPLADNSTNKTMIQVTSFSKTYPFNSYMITSASETKVVLDQAAALSRLMYDLAPDLIVSSHEHSDHYNPVFLKDYSEVPQIAYTVEDVTVKDAHVYTIASSHFDNKLDTTPLSNVLIVVEVDGLRIVHMGDIGQTELTQEQLDQLGEIDIAFMQFENSFSTMSNGNLKGYNIVNQVNPKIIIPTHYNKTSVDLLTERYGEIEQFNNVFTLTKDDLPQETKVIIIDNTLTFEKK